MTVFPNWETKSRGPLIALSFSELQPYEETPMSKFLTVFKVATIFLITQYAITALAQSRSQATIVGSVSSSDNARLAQKFKDSSFQTLDELQFYGISQVNGKTIDSMKRALGSVDVQFVQSIEVPERLTVGARSGAYWSRRENKIYVSREASDRWSDSEWRGMSTHETSALVDNEDNQFERSALIKSFIELKRSCGNCDTGNKASGILKQRIEMQFKNGGATGVGGGGDTRLLNVKSRLVTKITELFLNGSITEQEFSLTLLIYQLSSVNISNTLAAGKIVPGEQPLSFTISAQDFTGDPTSSEENLCSIMATQLISWLRGKI